MENNSGEELTLYHAHFLLNQVLALGPCLQGFLRRKRRPWVGLNVLVGQLQVAEGKQVEPI